MSDITLETLRDAILSRGLKGPWGCMPVAVWFVARHAEYVDLLKKTSRALECIAAPAYPREPIVPHLCGVPIFTFDPQGMSEAELACRPKFCSTPGVWLEMSAGQQIQLDKEEVNETHCDNDDRVEG